MAKGKSMKSQKKCQRRMKKESIERIRRGVSREKAYRGGERGRNLNCLPPIIWRMGVKDPKEEKK